MRNLPGGLVVAGGLAMLRMIFPHGDLCLRMFEANFPTWFMNLSGCIW